MSFKQLDSVLALVVVLTTLVGTVRMAVNDTNSSSNATMAPTTVPSVLTTVSCTPVTVCVNICNATANATLNATANGGNSTANSTAIPGNCTVNGTCCVCTTICVPASITNGGASGAPAPNSVPINEFANVDPRLCFALTLLYPTATPNQIASYASNVTNALTLLDGITSSQWTANCKQAMQLYIFLEDKVALNSDNGTLTTYARLAKLFGCKPDCNFKRLLTPANTIFSTNVTSFALSVMADLPTRVAQTCRKSFPILANLTAAPSASYLTSTPSAISLLTPAQMGAFSQSDSVSIAQALTSGNKQIPPALAKSLGANIPVNQSLSSVASIASGIPLAIFNSTAPDTLANLVSSMDLSNMNSFRKNFIGAKIASSNNATIIQNLLTSNSDSSIVSSIPSSLFSSLSINIASIPATNIPRAYLKTYARTQISNLASLSDVSTLGKILPGVTPSDLNAITNPATKISVITNLGNAGLTSGITPTSSQRSAMLSNLLTALTSYTSSSNATFYLGNLTTNQLEYLYPLFVEANATILAPFSKLSTFATVISKVSLLTTSQCCLFTKSARKTFATYAISYLFNYTTLTLSDLYKLGPCIVSALPSTYLAGISTSVFSSYFPTLGISFQPDATETTVIKSLISTIASTASTNQETLVFSTLSDLAMYYDFSASYASGISTTTWTTSGPSLMSTIKAVRDPTDSSVQMCQLGLGSTNTASISSSIGTYGSAYVTKYISSLSKRAATSLTCSELNDISSSLNTLTVGQLALISQSEFISCQTLLGASTNSWSSAQLTQLATTAKAYYVSASNISDTNIAALNSIMMGFSSTDLATLVFTSATSVSALGALNGWSTAQLSALATPLTNYLTLIGGTVTTDFITSAGNLMCCLTQTQISSVSSSVFNLAVTSLAKISLTCPNMGSWYTYAKNTTTFSSLLTSTSALTELGSILTGITTTDMQSISSDAISSISSTAWQYMPATVVNSLSLTQLNGLSTDQVTALVNSPNYASFSSSITGSLSSLSTGGAAVQSSSNLISNSNFLTIATLLAVIVFNLNL